jgi:hypothetical protein
VLEGGGGLAEEGEDGADVEVRGGWVVHGRRGELDAERPNAARAADSAMASSVICSRSIWRKMTHSGTLRRLIIDFVSKMWKCHITGQGTVVLRVVCRAGDSSNPSC